MPMIRIDLNNCCCCGHCQFVRMNLQLIKSVDGVDYYEDPRPEDQLYVGKYIAGCPTGAIEQVP